VTALCTECAVAAHAPAAVCCPNCWKWTELKNSTTCKRCGAPLVLPDGRRVDQARDGTAPQAIAMNAPTVSLAPLVVGTNWIAIARWITMAQGVLTVLGIFAIGLLVPSVTVPVQDPNTGAIINQTVNIRAFLAIGALVVIGFYALFIWLLKYGFMRAILLLIVAFELLVALGRMGSETPTAVIASIGSLIANAAFGFVLIMTFAAPQRRASVTARTPIPVPLASPPHLALPPHLAPPSPPPPPPPPQ
jgi:hypothetical protein